MSLKSAGSSAENSAAGYLYQFERALLWLATSPKNATVGIETLDDVVVRLDEEDKLILEQDKYTTQSRNTLSDASSDLWKTLGIWSLFYARKSAVNARFILSTNQVVDGCIAARFGKNPLNEGYAKETARLLQEKYKTLPEKIQRRAAPFARLNASDIIKLIQSIELSVPIDVRQADETRSRIIDHLHIPDGFNEELILRHAIGWLQDAVYRDWKNKKPAWISTASFNRMKFECLSAQKRSRRRERIANLILIDQTKAEGCRSKVFVRQIQETAVDEDVIESAIVDFLRASSERLRLAREGEVPRTEWKAYEQRLHQRWENLYRKLQVLHRGMPIPELGSLIYLETMGHREILAGEQTVEYYLANGTYHKMADAWTVGWIPAFKKLKNDQR